LKLPLELPPLELRSEMLVLLLQWVLALVVVPLHGVLVLLRELLVEQLLT
jgi:hypothetical protein